MSNDLVCQTKKVGDNFVYKVASYRRDNGNGLPTFSIHPWKDSAGNRKVYNTCKKKKEKKLD